eukprot:768380-Hanusia_phi.AAC.3
MTNKIHHSVAGLNHSDSGRPRPLKSEACGPGMRSRGWAPQFSVSSWHTQAESPGDRYSPPGTGPGTVTPVPVRGSETVRPPGDSPGVLAVTPGPESDSVGLSGRRCQ